MSTAVLDSIEQLQAAVVDLLKRADGGDFGALSEEEFLDAAREVEAIRRQLDTADHAVVVEVRSRDLPGTHLARTAQGFLGRLWRITPREAGARVREADSLGPRITQTGEVLAPLRPAAAAARKLGILNAPCTPTTWPGSRSSCWTRSTPTAPNRARTYSRPAATSGCGPAAAG